MKIRPLDLSDVGAGGFRGADLRDLPAGQAGTHLKPLGRKCPNRLWMTTATGTDMVATREAITWALARVQLANAPVSVTSVLAHLPQTPAETS